MELLLKTTLQWIFYFEGLGLPSKDAGSMALYGFNFS
jgi:hypothetical protein